MVKIWIGKRESDILISSYFDQSITFWGSNTGTNHAFCRGHRTSSNYTTEFTDYVIEEIKLIQAEYLDEIQMFFYNNSFAYKVIDRDNSLQKYIKNINSLYIHNLLKHKTLSRVWLSNTVSVPAFASLSKVECSIDHLKSIFPEFNRFIIQENNSGGGDGTYILDYDDENQVLSTLSSGKLYLVSPYYENNIPLSCAILIDQNGCMALPVAKQLLYISNNQLKYCGNQFYDREHPIYLGLHPFVYDVGNMLYHIGYRGICGLDWIYSNNTFYLIEINPRFQGSSFVIEKVLFDNHLPSLFELNTMCFERVIPEKIQNKLSKIIIPYENRCFFYGQPIPKIHSTDIVFYDGFDKATSFEEGCYLFRIISPPPL